MKNIVFVHGGDVMSKEYPVSEKNVIVYQKLFQLGTNRGLKMVWSNTRYFDETKNIFTAYSWFNGEKWIQKNEDIKPDYIFEKSVFKYKRITDKKSMAAAAPFLNPVEMQIIASDKMLTYLTFPNEVYTSLPISSNADILDSLDLIKSELVVFKPVNGFGGKGIEFLTHEQAKLFKPETSYIMQEFVDSSKGIPGIYDGIHDLRLLFLGNKLFHSFYRTQAPGTLMCNVTQGANRVVIPIENLPQEVIDLSEVVQKRFSHYNNNFYSVDFIFGENGKPKIIEINTTPGLDNAPGYDKHLIELYNTLLDHIEKFV